MPNYGKMRSVAGKEPERGPTANAVADNVRRLREALRLNYTELSDRLQDVAGWSINAVGIRRIESGERRVTPDDLMALAIACGVTPITLLMPHHDEIEADELVEITGLQQKVTAKRLWEWLRAQQTLTQSYQDLESFWTFLQAAEPRWIRVRRQNDLLADELRRREQRFLHENEGSGDGDD